MGRRGGNENGKTATSESVSIYVNPLYTDGLFHYYMLDESICHLRGVKSILSLLFYY